VLVLGSHLLATRSLRRLRDLRPFASLLVMAAVALPWFAAVAICRPGLLQELLLSGNLGRFLRGGSRPEPPLACLLILGFGFLPWSAFLPGAAGRVVLDRRRQEGSARRLLPLLWLLAVLVLSLLAGGRLSSPILPAFPAAALLVAGALAPWLDPAPPSRRLPGTGAMMALVLLTAGMAVFTWGPGTLGTLPLGFKAALLPLSIAALLGALLALGALLKGWSRIACFLLLGGSGVFVLALLIYGFPQLEDTRSSRGAAAAIAAQIRPSDGLILYREDRPGFAYYLRRTPDVVRDEEDLVRRLESGKRLYCLMGRVRYERLRLRRRELPLYLLRSAGNVVVVTSLPPGASP
jgi:4-amino-4-deoxy-L-arabinose transferase-like glycosyltransferase